MLITNFQIKDKVGRPKLFQKIFLITNNKFEVILEMFFLKIGNTDILFSEKTLI